MRVLLVSLYHQISSVHQVCVCVCVCVWLWFHTGFNASESFFVKQCGHLCDACSKAAVKQN